MTTRANRVILGKLPTYKFGIDAYDPDKLGLGPLMKQQTGVSPEDNYAGPFSIAVARPMEASVANAFGFPWAMRWSESSTSQKDWIFVADIAPAAATRRIGMYEFDRITGVFSYGGFITVTFPGTSEAKTIRGLRMSYEKVTTGTVAVSGTAVTGSGTQFVIDRPCVGNRIGFGSTNPEQITQWYEISSIGSDTSITLTSSAGTIAAGTPYVIEDLRAYLICTSATTSLGGLYVMKGLRKELFSPAGGAVPAGTTVDRIRASYFLKDDATGTALVSFGCAMEEKTNLQNRSMWIMHTLANPIMIKYNVYADLTLTSGAATNALILVTGAGGAVSGTTSQMNNGRLANTSHGPGAGKDCIYFTTTTRIYRSTDLSTITSGMTDWISDNMVEIPPGSGSTFAATAALQAIEYTSVLDKFIITSSGTAGARSYISQYRTDGGQMDRIIFVDMKQSDQSLADSTTTPFPAQMASLFMCWVEGGVLYAARNGTAASSNQIYVVPIGADWEYIATSGSRLVLPRIPTPGADKYIAAFAQEVQVVGGATGKNLGMSTEPFRIQFRTSGITDNSGGWTPLDSTGDLTGVSGAPYIQFRCEFRISNTMIPSRILNVGVLYDEIEGDDHFLISDKSDPATKQFVWWFAAPFGGTVPPLRVRIYDAVTKSLLVDDDTATPTGTWEKSTNGSTWTAWNNTDRTNDTTYYRYTPASIADSVVVQPILTVV